jgi:endonuclease III
MTAPAVNQEGWTALLERLRTSAPTPHPTRHLTPDSPIIDWCVYSLLLWETTTSVALAAWGRLHQRFVDYNDLRVSTRGEVLNALGDKYPLAVERAVRLRAMLYDIFEHQNALTLEHLRQLPKRDARARLLALDGCPESVANGIYANALSGHAFAIDDRLRTLLVRAQVAAPKATAHEIAAWLEHHTPVEDSHTTMSLLRAWSDSHTQGLRPSAASQPANPTTPTTMSTTSPTTTKPRARKNAAGGPTA